MSSRSAARTAPFSSSARKRPTVLTASIRSVVVFSAETRSSMVSIVQSALPQDQFQPLPIRVADRRERRANRITFENAEHLHGRLHGNRIRLDEVAREERQEADVNRSS